MFAFLNVHVTSADHRQRARVHVLAPSQRPARCWLAILRGSRSQLLVFKHLVSVDNVAVSTHRLGLGIRAKTVFIFWLPSSGLRDLSQGLLQGANRVGLRCPGLRDLSQSLLQGANQLGLCLRPWYHPRGLALHLHLALRVLCDHGGWISCCLGAHPRDLVEGGPQFSFGLFNLLLEKCSCSVDAHVRYLLEHGPQENFGLLSLRGSSNASLARPRGRARPGQMDGINLHQVRDHKCS